MIKTCQPPKEYYYKTRRKYHTFYKYWKHGFGFRWRCHCGSHGRFVEHEQQLYKLWLRHVRRHGKFEPITHGEMMHLHIKMWNKPYPFKG